MVKSKIFERELALIDNKLLSEQVERFLDEYVPEYFWHIGASSSGKYHPKFSQGEGGLVRHTKAVAMFAEELLRMSSYAYMKQEYKDYVVAACILHDTFKYGSGREIDKEEYKHHGKTAAIAFNNFWCETCSSECSPYLLNAIASHMGQWTPEKEDRPFTNIDRCVHMADYMASRNFIDIPQITEEWENCLRTLSHGKR